MDLAKVLELVVGGGLLGLAMTLRAARTERYRALDEAYRALLGLYLEYPQYARGDDGSPGYHGFAMNVHAFTETMFDVLGKRRVLEDATWREIFRYHVTLHGSWLLANRTLHEAAYVDFVTDEKLVSPAPRANAQLAAGTPVPRSAPADRREA